MHREPALRRRPLEKMLPVVMAVLAAVIGWRFWQSAHAPEKLLARAREALRERQYLLVERLANDIPADAPQSSKAMLLAGEAAEKDRRWTNAIAYYERVNDDRDAVAARCAVGKIWLELGHASKAEASYRAALAIDADCFAAHERLAWLLGAEGRRFESLEHLYAMLRQGNFSLELLLLTGEHAVNMELPEELERFHAAAADDPAPAIGLARIEMRKKEYTKAIDLLRRVIVKAPKLIEAHALLGRMLLERPGDKELAAWEASLPDEAASHPDVWVVRGTWARRRGENERAARSFWEALRRDPNHQIATLQLSQLLAALGEPARGEDLAQRAATLSDFSSALEFLNRSPNDAEHLLLAARYAETLGRLWEAWAWNQMLLKAVPDSTWARTSLARIGPHLGPSLPATLGEVDPAVQLDLSHYPLPEITRPREHAVATDWSPGRASPRFNDVAHEAGIAFSYFCGREANDPRTRMYQAFGGGIAVGDFDADGWPDLYLTQGCRWPPQAGQIEHLDTLYRNLGGGRFADVTKSARLGDERFSNGATVGDLNNDGFADLYVANIGVNRLYVNNGDGTFDDVRASAGIAAAGWTTSCLLADLSGDGMPDLYDVNYVQGTDVFERVCNDNGMPGTCRPGVFEPAPDRFYLNRGDGRFEEMTDAVGMSVRGGNGLGVVAANFGNGRLNVFVANDQDANFYFVNRTFAGNRRPLFEERGVLSGLAYDGNGMTLACMGIAAGDADGDGKLDLLVTNFQEESSTLYLQLDSESFTDATGPAGLREPSFPMLGFGTQFLDGELDGLSDLVVTNGHIHESSSRGVSLAMRPQYFRNRGGGRFEELPPQGLGAYFQQAYFGRSLARLDFNRDGREDFAVSALESPLALVRNATEGAGHFLAVQLRGVNSSRDAIGAVVTIEVENRRQTQWLNAGDGYQASNQRQLVFGLGEATKIDRLQISWPSGLDQQFRNLDADLELVFTEGSPSPTSLRAAR